MPAAMATGHMLGDTGDFSNTIYTGFPVPGRRRQPDAVPRERPGARRRRRAFRRRLPQRGDDPAGGARAPGYSTASIGKLGPAPDLRPHRAHRPERPSWWTTCTGRPGGIPLLGRGAGAAASAPSWPVQAPTRGDNGKAGTATDARHDRAPMSSSRTTSPTLTTKAVLPLFKERGKPFALVFWSRDPDGTQHNQGDSLGRLIPGINGPTSLAVDQQRRRRSRPPAGGAAAARPRRGHRRDPHLRPRLLHDLQGERDELGGRAELPGRARAVIAAGLRGDRHLAHALGLPLYDPSQGMRSSSRRTSRRAATG